MTISNILYFFFSLTFLSLHPGNPVMYMLVYMVVSPRVLILYFPHYFLFLFLIKDHLNQPIFIFIEYFFCPLKFDVVSLVIFSVYLLYFSTPEFL